MDSYQELSRLVTKLRRDAIEVWTECNQTRQLIGESRQLLFAISQQLQTALRAGPGDQILTNW
jgi:hypothetical protein